MIGKPTLLVTFGSRLEAQKILGAIGALNYPLDDVSVYYRLVGTDQVLDATTGQIAAGQALNDDELKKHENPQFETLVLMHPTGAQFVALQSALQPFGQADYKYAGETEAEGSSEGMVRRDENPQQERTT